LSLASELKVYYNGRRYGGDGRGRRAFLALRVGAGSAEVRVSGNLWDETDPRKLKTILERVIHPILGELHLPLYHETPEFHASFAWCLLQPTTGSTSSSTSEAALADQSETSSEAASSPFTKEIVQELNGSFQQLILSTQPSAGWTISAVDLKISKDVFHIPLRH